MAKTALELIASGLSKLLAVSSTKAFPVIADVDSSAIQEIRYDPRRATMMITFQSGAVYDYFGVPPEQVDALINSGSVGKTFVQEVRNDYIYVKIG